MKENELMGDMVRSCDLKNQGYSPGKILCKMCWPILLII